MTATADRTLALFIRCWTVPIILDGLDGRDYALRQLVMVPLALLAFCFPSAAALALLSAGYVAVVLQAPFVSWHVHQYVASALHLCVLLSIAVMLCRRRWPSAIELLSLLRWPARLIATGVFFAGLSKINRDFLDPRISCGGVYYLWLREWPGLDLVLPTGDAARRAAIYGAIVMELTGPLLLWHRRTRPVGLGLIWLLTLGLSSNTRSVYFEFVGLFWACSLFWLDPSVLSGAAEAWARLWNRLTAPLQRLLEGRPLARAGLKLALAGALWTAMQQARSYHLARPWIFIWLVAGILTIVTVTWAVVYAVRLDAAAKEPFVLDARAAAGPLRFVVLLAPLLFLFNEAVVYLGWPHKPALKMASNFIATGDRTNHLLLAAVPRLAFAASGGLEVLPPYTMSKARYFCEKPEPGFSKPAMLREMKRRVGEDEPPRRKKRPKRRARTLASAGPSHVHRQRHRQRRAGRSS